MNAREFVIKALERELVSIEKCLAVPGSSTEPEYRVDLTPLRSSIKLLKGKKGSISKALEPLRGDHDGDYDGFLDDWFWNADSVFHAIEYALVRVYRVKLERPFFFDDEGEADR